MIHMRIGVVGGGVVGQATARSYLEHVQEVRVYDLRKELATHTLERVLECDLIFLCLPTPARVNLPGSPRCHMGLDITPIREFCDELPARCKKQHFVLKSTVPIGTTRFLREIYNLTNLVHSPEFLTARCALVDAQVPSRNVIGDPSFCSNVAGGSGLCDTTRMLNALYGQRFPQAPIYLMTSDESEAVKLFQNSFFAVKVAYWNEVQQLASKLGLDWPAILEAILVDGRIHPSHTQVPGPDGQYGFAGSCLPKDLSELVGQIITSGLPCWVTQGAYTRNVLDRTRQPVDHTKIARKDPNKPTTQQLEE